MSKGNAPREEIYLRLINRAFVMEQYYLTNMCCIAIDVVGDKSDSAIVDLIFD